jgi:hypothetical protein
MRRGLIALLLAFGWLFSTPAHATPLVTGDTLQFSYTWGSFTRTITDSVVTVTVVNDITNKIGGNGEVVDTYRITFADQVIEVTEKHGPRDYTFSGSGTLTLEGIDRGFWAGYYGPVMTVSVSPIVQPEEPTTQSPETESSTTSPSESPTQSATLSPEPEVQPTPLPLPEPSPTPTVQPEPTPEATPLETPTASSPTQSPEPEPTRSPIVEVEPEPTSESPAPTTSPTPQPIQPEPQPSPIIEPTPVQSSEVISEEPSTTTAEVIEVAEETFANSVSEAVEAAVTEVVKAVGQLVEAFAIAGLDMTPEQREEAQDVVVSTVIASQVAAGIRKIK